jgi:hypothetical protein
VGSHGRWKRPLPSKSSRDHVILRVELVGSREVETPLAFKQPPMRPADAIPVGYHTVLCCTHRAMLHGMRGCSSQRNGVARAPVGWGGGCTCCSRRVCASATAASAPSMARSGAAGSVATSTRTARTCMQFNRDFSKVFIGA